MTVSEQVADAESSIRELMMTRLGEGGLRVLESPAAAMVAEAAASDTLRQRAVEEKEERERGVLAEAVARQSALSLEARAVVAGAVA
jgi:streptomycin 6-kinase